MSNIDTERLEHSAELLECESEAALDMYFVGPDYIAAEVLDTVAGVAVDGKEPGNMNLLLLREEEEEVEVEEAEPGHMKPTPQW